MVAAEAVKLKRAEGDLVEAENKQIALSSELVSMRINANARSSALLPIYLV
jgi:predicted methyltransferase MtxX (methanogen marker protein 4)